VIAVGVDAGGTGTELIGARDGTEIGKACAGPAQPSSRGVEAAAETIARAVLELVSVGEPFTLFVGAAGAGRSSTARALEEHLRARLPAVHAVRVEDDARIALRAAIPEGAGIALIAGTGSMAYAEHGERRVRIGGAGYLVGDEGSGFAIGLAALRAAARAFDGLARADAITEMIARELGIADHDALLNFVYALPVVDVARIASLAPHVLAFAGAGDRTATNIVQFAAKELGDLTCAAARQAELMDACPSIALCGGLLHENSLLTYVLQTRLQADIPGASIIRSSVTPAWVAVRLAETLFAKEHG
jgi:N-acetylmuramic acid 6-phosphate etherase